MAVETPATLSVHRSSSVWAIPAITGPENDGASSCPWPDVLPLAWCLAHGLVSCPGPGILPLAWCLAPGLASCPGPDDDVGFNVLRGRADISGAM